MDIYKLKDDVDGAERKKDRRCDELVITELKAGVKNPERVNVYINNEYKLSLFVAQVVEFKLKVGKVVTEAELLRLEQASEYGKLYQRALEWVMMRPRSEREVYEYLRGKLRKSSSDTLLRARRYGAQSLCTLPVGRVDSSEDFSELLSNIISKFCSRGYVDDRKFAEWWVENRFLKKGVSQKRLRMELMSKGVSNEIIDEVLGGRDERAEIEKMIAKKRAKYNDEKLIAYLCRQGFSYELVKELVR